MWTFHLFSQMDLSLWTWLSQSKQLVQKLANLIFEQPCNETGSSTSQELIESLIAIWLPSLWVEKCYFRIGMVKVEEASYQKYAALLLCSLEPSYWMWPKTMRIHPSEVRGKFLHSHPFWCSLLPILNLELFAWIFYWNQVSIIHLYLLHCQHDSAVETGNC